MDVLGVETLERQIKSIKSEVQESKLPQIDAVFFNESEKSWNEFCIYYNNLATENKLNKHLRDIYKEFDVYHQLIFKIAEIIDSEINSGSTFDKISNFYNEKINFESYLIKNLKAEIQKQNEPEQQIPPVETDNEQHIL